MKMFNIGPKRSSFKCNCVLLKVHETRANKYMKNAYFLNKNNAKCKICKITCARNVQIQHFLT